MELILKPTELCNFACTFCSSSSIANSNKTILDLEHVFTFLKRFPETNTIILNGGDPLMISTDYYWKIIEYLEENDLPATLSFTTNLWDFYKKPEKWSELFLNERVGVTTSFNYGNTRQVRPGLVYTEDMFWEISDLMLEKIGYRPGFISVITDENEDTAIDNVKLAKKMDVECKLNYAMASGRESKPYLLSKIYQTYLEIYDLGLTEWEFNTKQMIKRLSTEHTVCPQSRNCDEGIRAFNPDGPSEYYSCGSIADDRDGYKIDFKREMAGEFFIPLQNDFDLLSMKNECLSCNMFKICNGCRKTIKDLKYHNLVEDHCKLMKEISGRIINIKK